MLDFIRGKVFKVKPDRVVIDVGGLGFSVRIPVRLSEKLSDTEEVFLYTYLSIKKKPLKYTVLLTLKIGKYLRSLLKFQE